jgi:hypothetical protein
LDSLNFFAKAEAMRIFEAIIINDASVCWTVFGAQQSKCLANWFNGDASADFLFEPLEVEGGLRQNQTVSVD